MFEYLQRLLGSEGLAPHGFCLFWDPALIWTHVVADALIGLAYFSIPVAMAVFLTKREDVRFRGVAWLFVAFILACGTTHFFSIVTLWYPYYGAEALVKLVTAGVSVATAVVLWPMLPRALALPSPAQLQQANAALQLRVAERDAALSALATATVEREAAQAMLRQAQKMEALGQLTGGIAHDFNNLLTIVVANIDRARRLAGDDERVASALENARTGADRAARLTDQLLAFARRQPLRPESHDLNQVVRQSADLFGETLGAGIRIETDLGSNLWPVAVDRGQTENALLNLLVNARDAMPAGGMLRIITANAATAEGDRIMLEVSDTGEGMDEATRQRAFEPFFTTKPIGSGSGLGLAQVYGFAEQSGGTVVIESEAGAGTTVRLFLPRAESDITAAK